jgi:hypothetical protein
MGYSRGYVANIEAGKQAVTDRFVRRFEELRLADPSVVVLWPPRPCACGCGTVFVGGSAKQKYLNRQHQVRGYNKVRRPAIR